MVTMGYEREHTHPPDDAPRSTVQARPAVTAGGAITAVYESAMVTSTSTFGSMLMDVCTGSKQSTRKSENAVNAAWSL